MPSMDDIGKLILRLAVGSLMLPYGMAKFKAAEFIGVQAMLAGKSLPEFLAYGVYVGEIVAPILLIIGYFTRPAAVVFAFNMLVAIGLAHMAELTRLTVHGGLELSQQYLFLFGSIAIAFLGAGKLSVSGGNGRWS